jgi:hypothetical protein
MAEIPWRQLVKLHNVQKIDFEGADMILTVDGQVYRVNLTLVSKRLAGAEEPVRRRYSVSPSGYGIHWPEIDEDLTVAGLIAVSSQEPRPVAVRV